MNELELYECFCGGRIGPEQRFYVIAKEFGKAMKATFEHLGAKTSDDLPKPFLLERVKTPVVIAGPKKRTP
jgi:hypothetical protein